jgi:site-specific recombinase XerD
MLTSQDRRPSNNDVGLEVRILPQAARVRPPDQDTLRDFRDHLHAKGVSHKTLHTYLSAAQAFGAFCSEHGMPDLENATREHIEAWLRDMRERGNKPATIKNRFSSLRSLFTWQIYADIRRDSPMKNMEPPRVPVQVMPDYDATDVGRLLDSIPARQGAYAPGARRQHLMNLRDRALIALAFDTGARSQELCDITMQDIDRDVRRIVIRAGKGGKGRIIGYSPETAGLVSRYLRARGGSDSLPRTAPLFATEQGASLTYNAMRCMLRRRFAAAGLTFAGAHPFRRGWAQSMLNSGASPLDVQALGGWTSQAMVSRYVAASAQERALRAAEEHAPMSRVNAGRRQ